MDLAKEVYEITKQLPNEEKFGLVSQMRRAAVSVPANVAEGLGRKNTGEFLYFLGIARGSLLELETMVKLCKELDLIKESKHVLNLCDQCGKLISASRKTLTIKKQTIKANP